MKDKVRGQKRHLYNGKLSDLKDYVLFNNNETLSCSLCVESERKRVSHGSEKVLSRTTLLMSVELYNVNMFT